ncbi:hypoxanthine-guanine phosphoribosyltransferase [Gilvimarinus sp. SDUM040013]|uniref:Hypoxanthine-guanine phosphoribosyltransferase n=1 Tax=Gilvimarinus gilvus TaxID=3058038 RepID=A0ABU4RXL4_9GAMM|nr:hypoxanthine-guanine phosphoribosyltransferase [Gilvimarinus sp. SDUM040013]MDO3386389.1 hypoxanthine-guanine phosphoribosyltransferase [Gilvimarinus sp. SDUM040013]MDX6849655.1 hypoxanthine-guanine phosphoribosyltransferase [Gilvimarinus sp. SDUM040013]
MRTTCLFDLPAIDAALGRVAVALNQDMHGLSAPPLVLVVMKGALVTAGALLPKLNFALEVDYVHATRYQHNNAQSELMWLHEPTAPIAGRQVILVDDILDEGITLAEVANYCRNKGAAAVTTLVLLRKDRSEPPRIEADYVALHAPDGYVFGYGMDDNELSRNLPGIYVHTP